MNTKVLGDAGETLAAEYLQKKAAEFSRKNLRLQAGRSI